MMVFCGVRAVEIAKDGAACAEIIVDSGSNGGTSVIAALDLQRHLELISGAKLDIVSEPSGKVENMIFVGGSDVARKHGFTPAKFSRSGYEISITENAMYLDGPCANIAGGAKVQKMLGMSDIGPMYAVSAFLEELGVRFYAPGEEGTIIPEKSTIALPSSYFRTEAAFDIRLISSDEDPDMDTAMWFKRMKSGSALPPAGRIEISSLMQGKAAVPAICAEMSEGVLFPVYGSKDIVPRYTSAEFKKLCLEAVVGFFRENPAAVQVSIVPPAAVGMAQDWRDEKVYRKLGVSQRQAFVNMMYDFHMAIASEMAVKCPGKQLIWTCPGNIDVPKNIDNANIPGNLCFKVGNVPPAYYSQTRTQNKYFQNMDAMAPAGGKSPKTFQGEDWLDYGFGGVPVFPEYFMNELQKVRRRQESYFNGFEINVPVVDGKLVKSALSHFMLYVNSRLMWNPDIDMEFLLDEYCRLWFGPAAAEMKEFHELAEKVWCTKGFRSISVKDGFMKQEDADDMLAILKEAGKKVCGEEVYGRRVAELAKAFAGLKTIFAEYAPAGEWTEATILPAASEPDGNFSKYMSKWMPLNGDAKGEVAIGVTENTKYLFVAVRCRGNYGAMNGESVRKIDDYAIFNGENVRICLTAPRRNWFAVAVNPNGDMLDESFDLDVINRDGSHAAWNPGTKTFVRRLEDGWECEVSIPVEDFKRPGPSVDDPWGINVCRTAMKDGKEVVSALVPDADETPAKWFRLWKKSQDCDGRFVNSFGYVVARNREYPEPYTVARAKGPVDLAGEWDGKCWKDVKSLKLDLCMSRPGDKNIHLPDTQAKLQYDDKNLYVMFQVKDRYVQSLARNDMESVCLDSCVEFFVRPCNTPKYYNFEMNCGGKLLLFEIENINAGKLNVATADELKSIRRYHSMPEIIDEEIQEPVTWRVCYSVPIDFFVRRAGIEPDLSGQVWTANFFKCADRSSHYHWMSWNPSEGFHFPDDFGKIIFE